VKAANQAEGAYLHRRREQNTAVANLTRNMLKQNAADRANAKQLAIDKGPQIARDQLTKHLSDNTQEYVKKLGGLATAYGKQAAQNKTSNPILAANESHMQKVATAAEEVAKRINGIPTAKQISIQVAIDAVVSQVTGRPSGRPGDPHHRATGGPVEAGQAYVVGDGVGPELFVPNVDGRISKNLTPHGLGGGSGGNRSALTITNWEDGTGYIEQVSDGSVRRHSRLTRQHHRMGR
jgi:hypothetical protein